MLGKKSKIVCNVVIGRVQSSILMISVGGGGEWYSSKPYRYVPPQRVGFLRSFSLKTGIDFAHFDLDSGVVFKGTTGVYERIYCFNCK